MYNEENKCNREVIMSQATENIQKIFNENGEVKIGGWSKAPLFEYNKELCSLPNKLTEKDCYYISNKDMGFYFSVETVGTELSIKLVFTDFNTGEIVRDYVTKKFWLEPRSLPESGSLGEFSYTDKRIALTMTNTVDGRYIKCDFIDFNNYKNLFVKVLVTKKSGDSLNMVAPFEKFPKCFYLKRFVPKFIASGVVRLGGTDYILDEENSYVYFNWNRYYLPKKQKFQALSAVTNVNGKRFAINLASKVGSNRKGSENCYFLDNYMRKIGRLKVGGDEKNPLGQWYFTSSDKSAELVFTPDEADGKAVGCKCEKLSFINGRLSGTLADLEGTAQLENVRAHMIFTIL